MLNQLKSVCWIEVSKVDSSALISRTVSQIQRLTHQMFAILYVGELKAYSEE